MGYFPDEVRCRGFELPPEEAASPSRAGLRGIEVPDEVRYRGFDSEVREPPDVQRPRACPRRVDLGHRNARAEPSLAVVPGIFALCRRSAGFKTTHIRSHHPSAGPTWRGSAPLMTSPMEQTLADF